MGEGDRTKTVMPRAIGNREVRHLQIMIIKKQRLCDTVAALKMRSLDALMHRTAQGMTIKRNAKHSARDDNKNGGAVRN